MPRLPKLLLLGWFWLPLVPASDDLPTRLRSLYDAGEYAQVVELAERALETPPDILVYHGLALARLERFEQAHAVLRQGRQRYPQDKRFPLELAGVAYRTKRIAEAKSFLRQALSLDRRDKYANEFLGSLYLLERNVAGALKYWNRIDKPLIQGVTVAPPPTLDPVLRERAVAISGGQILTLARFRTTEANLDRLNIFVRRQIELTPRQDERFDVTIRLLPIEPPLTGWLGRLLPVARALPYQIVHFDRYNIANRAINFKSLWRWDPHKRRIGLELAGPIRLNPRFRYRLVADARDENWTLLGRDQTVAKAAPDLQLRKVAFGGDLVFALSEKLEWTTGGRLARRGFRNHDGSAIFADSWSFEQRNQLAYCLLDLPERHIRADSRARLRTGRVFTGESSRFGIVEGDLAGFWKPPAEESPWEAQLRLRAGKTFGRIPFDEFFQLGMERDNDLWLRGHAGTRDGRKGNAPLGTNYVLLQTDFDRRVAQFGFLRVRAGPFFDTGRINGPSNRFGSHGWLLDSGVQAKVIAAGFSWSVIYGRDLRGGHGVFYTTVQY